MTTASFSPRYSPATRWSARRCPPARPGRPARSEEHTSELQSRENLVCRLLTDAPPNGTYPRSLHDALPIYETFSYLTTRAEEEAFLRNAAYFGFGFVMRMTDDSRIFLAEVFPGNAMVSPPVPASPAWKAGLRRGDEIVSVDGVSVATLIATGQINDAFGPDKRGHTVTLGV